VQQTTTKDEAGGISCFPRATSLSASDKLILDNLSSISTRRDPWLRRRLRHRQVGADAHHAEAAAAQAVRHDQASRRISTKLNEPSATALDMRLGVLFQQGALSALTVKENIQVPMREYLDLPVSADGRAGAC
jgi:hypothetical protein